MVPDVDTVMLKDETVRELGLQSYIQSMYHTCRCLYTLLQGNVPLEYYSAIDYYSTVNEYSYAEQDYDDVLRKVIKEMIHSSKSLNKNLKTPAYTQSTNLYSMVYYLRIF